MISRAGIDQSCDEMNMLISCPFTLIDEMSNDEFDFFLRHDRYQLPNIEKESIINILNMILAKGGDEQKELIIYKILAE